MAGKRSARATLIAVLLAVAPLNWDLFMLLVLPVAQVVVLPMKVGLPLFGGIVVLSGHRIFEAASMAPWAPTPLDDFAAHLEAAEVDFSGPDDSIFLDLGSGDGRALVYARQKGGYTHALGLERNPIMVWISILRFMYEGCSSDESCDVHRGTVTQSALPRITPHAIYSYLDKTTTKSVAKRLACLYPAERDGKPLRRPKILSRDFPLPGWEKAIFKNITRGATKLYVYDPKLFQPPCHNFESFLLGTYEAPPPPNWPPGGIKREDM